MTDAEVDSFMDKLLDEIMPSILEYMDWRYRCYRAICKYFWPGDIGLEEAEQCK